VKHNSSLKDNNRSGRQEILSSAFIELEGSLPSSQNPTTGPHSEQNNYNEHIQTLFI
jgi:hypothetical protein